MPQCASCGVQAEKLLICGQCRAVHYCSAECQRSAWKEHKKSCSRSVRQKTECGPVRDWAAEDAGAGPSAMHVDESDFALSIGSRVYLHGLKTAETEPLRRALDGRRGVIESRAADGRWVVKLDVFEGHFDFDKEAASSLLAFRPENVRSILQLDSDADSAIEKAAKAVAPEGYKLDTAGKEAVYDTVLAKMNTAQYKREMAAQMLSRGGVPEHQRAEFEEFAMQKVYKREDVEEMLASGNFAF